MIAKAHIRLIPSGSDQDIPVQSMRMDRDMAHPVGRAMLVLPAGISPPEVGGEVRLVAVFNGAEQPLMAGNISYVNSADKAASLTVLEPISALLVPAPAKAYSATTAGQIISDICADKNVPTATILPGITIPHMVLGAGISLLDHCLRLAKLSGLALVSDDQGRVGTKSLALPIPSGSVDTSRAAQALHSIKSAQTAGKARITGAGAMGANGPGMTTLPLADPSQIQSGPADATLQFRAAALRILSDTLTLQMAADQRNAAALSGAMLHTPLPESVSPGDVVMIPDASGLPMRATRIEALTVMLSMQTGLTARYAFSDVKVA